MKCAELIEPEPLTKNNQSVIQLPLGLLGFETIKRYELLGNPDEAPFMWFRMLDDPALAFLVISPFMVAADYQPDLCDTDTQFLELNTPEDALIFNIVTLHKDGTATVNLKGPIVVNRHTLIGKQVVPNNAIEYALQHPLALGQ